MLSGKAQRQYHLMLLIPMIFLFVFGVLPKFGVVMAFQKFIPAKGFLGSKWVGLKYFRYMFELPDSWQVFENTLIIAVSKLVLGLIAPIVFALLLNEVRSVRLKRSVQTITYMPHFLSWVVLAIPVMNLFAYDGVVNNLAAALGGKRVLFMASNTYFRPILIFSHVWKEFGYGAIVYLAAIAGINPELYESAVIDGAGRAQRMRYVTLPGMLPTIVLVGTMALGSILNAGFDQVYNLYSPVVYATGDVIDTYVYRVGLLQMNYSLGTAVGVLKSLISLILTCTAYFLAYKLADYRIF